MTNKQHDAGDERGTPTSVGADARPTDKKDGGAPQTPAAEQRSSDEEGWEEGYKACKAGAQQAGGAAVQEALAWADDHAAGLVRSLAQPSRARVATLAAEVRRLQAQPTAQEPPVLSLNEAYQRICDLFAYEENEKALNDGLLHILRMATRPDIGAVSEVTNAAPDAVVGVQQPAKGEQ